MKPYNLAGFSCTLLHLNHDDGIWFYYIYERNSNEDLQLSCTWSITYIISYCLNSNLNSMDKIFYLYLYTSRIELNPIQLWSKKYSGIPQSDFSSEKNLSHCIRVSSFVFARANLPNLVPGKFTKFFHIAQWRWNENNTRRQPNLLRG